MDITTEFKKSKQLIPYFMAGFPTVADSKAAIELAIKSGCRLIEIGIPFSDPLADGPTIQKASEVALANKTNTDVVFNLIAELTSTYNFIPIVMVYYNLVYHYGLERFAKQAKASGVKGLIIPDLTVEESDAWLKVANASNLDSIFLAAPTSSLARLRLIGEKSSGFVYAVSLTGVTGARKELPPNLANFLELLKQAVSLPVAVGFGISRPEQVKEVLKKADGAVVGSALIDIISKNKDYQPKLKKYLTEMVEAARSA